MSTSVTIHLRYWDEYNPRKDFKSMPWVKIANDLPFSKILFGLSASQKWAFVCIITECARQYSDTITIDAMWCKHYWGIDEEELIALFKHLESHGYVTITNGSVRTRTDTNESVAKRREEKRREEKKREEIYCQSRTGASKEAEGQTENSSPPNPLQGEALVGDDNCADNQKSLPPKPKAPRSDFAHHVIDYLNQKTGKSFRATTPKTIRQIDARRKEGFELSDFHRVIDNKCKTWADNADMRPYLRPDTLFGSKFESYLNEDPTTLEDDLAKFFGLE